jgi:hypothetical protein
MWGWHTGGGDGRSAQAVLLPHPHLGATASAEGAQCNVSPFPATASAEGRLIKGGPFPATVWAEGRQFNGAPFPARGEGVCSSTPVIGVSVCIIAP